MKVKLIRHDGWADDGTHGVQVFVDGHAHFELMSGEPEDAVVYRDWWCLLHIPAMMRAAYEAGKRGESFEVETETREYE